MTAKRTRRTAPKKQSAPGLKYQIDFVEAAAKEPAWTRLAHAVQPFVKAGRQLAGDAYALAAKTALERVEAFEDRRAEKKAKAAGLAAASQTSAAARPDGKPPSSRTGV